MPPYRKEKTATREERSFLLFPKFNFSTEKLLDPLSKLSFYVFRRMFLTHYHDFAVFLHDSLCVPFDQAVQCRFLTLFEKRFRKLEEFFQEFLSFSFLEFLLGFLGLLLLLLLFLLLLCLLSLILNI